MNSSQENKDAIDAIKKQNSHLRIVIGIFFVFISILFFLVFVIGTSINITPMLVVAGGAVIAFIMAMVFSIAISNEYKVYAYIKRQKYFSLGERKDRRQ